MNFSVGAMRLHRQRAKRIIARPLTVDDSRLIAQCR